MKKRESTHLSYSKNQVEAWTSELVHWGEKQGKEPHEVYAILTMVTREIGEVLNISRVEISEHHGENCSCPVH